jgi:hypothetical protein
MAKINPNLLPAARPSRIEEVRVPVPAQGDFLVYLRRPEFSELLKLQEEAQARVREWDQTGNWYPSTPPVQPSESLWQVVVPALHLQVTEAGDDLSPEERYVEQELVPLVGRVPAIYTALAAAVTVLTLEAQDDLGNA